MTSKNDPSSLVKLDPRAVLAHLNSLGYCHITGQQLKVFMKDLKKLIISDHMKKDHPVSVDVPSILNMRDKENQNPCYESINKTHYHKTKNTDHLHERSTKAPVDVTNHHSPQKRKCSIQCHQKNKKTSIEKSKSQPFSSTSNLTKASASSSSLSSIQNVPPPTASSATQFRNHQPKSLKPSSSTTTFIRPWHTKTNTIHKAGTSSDPVALYQHYKELWKLQPLPGEDNRSELRWKIREKLLTCNPTPRLPQSISRRS